MVVRIRSMTVSSALATLFLVSAMAGCLDLRDTPDVADARAPIDIAGVVAIGATIEAVADGVSVVWEGPVSVDDGFHVTIPEGVTLVEARRVMADPDDVTYLRMFHDGTGRIRCQPDIYQTWFDRTAGMAPCTGLTVLDPLPAIWRSNDFRSITVDDLGNELGDGLDLLVGERFEVLLRNDPLDGEAARIDLSTLSMPEYGLADTIHTTIAASADGEPIWVEYTTPEGEGPWPTIIVSSPYNDATRKAGLRPQNSTIADWVPRGYAVVSADVRGFGDSGGCVEVWGANEQSDQVDLVNWVAAQSWSDKKIGFYGQSYVATTPLAAAANGAEELDAIIVVAPVVNAYEDWHFGGVANGEDVLSPTVAYQVLGTRATMNQEDPYTSAWNVGNGLCDPTLGLRANDPREVYDAFYEERDFKLKVGNIKAATLYTQGFYDSNVKSMMIPRFFNEIEAPKKGLFGDWVHQHPVRGDQELYFHAWFDHYLKDRPTGIDATPVVEVKTNVDTLRFGDTWPPREAEPVRWGMELGCCTKELGVDHGSGSEGYQSVPDHRVDPSDLPTGMVPGQNIVVATEPLGERLYIAGEPTLRLKATLENMENHFFYAALYDVDEQNDTRSVITFGMLNAALRNGYRTYEPVTPASTITGDLPFMPTEYVVPAGHVVELEMRAVDGKDWAALGSVPVAGVGLPESIPFTGLNEPGTVTLHADGDDGTALMLPIIADPGDVPMPRTAGPFTSEQLALSGLVPALDRST